jgi:phage tail sheath protein FI
MPVNPTYPGIYIEELPNQAHTITAAPTSVAVFVGYTHPFKTKQFGKAVQVFNFTEYEREFGGLYASGAISASVPYALNQFFLNGGSVAYVVGLKPRLYDRTTGAIKGDYVAATTTVATANLVLDALEPTDTVPMTVTISNVRKTTAADDTADLQIAYGTRAETFRGLNLSASAAMLDRLKDSTLVAASATALGSSWPAATTITLAFPAAAAINSPPFTSFSIADFTGVFAADSSLDKVDIFNLLVLPGVSDASVWATALAFAEGKRAFALLDPPANYSADGVGGLPEIKDAIALVPKSANGAFYFPYLNTTDPLNGKPITLPPSGYVAGIYARTDNNRGVWKAPAGLETTVNNTVGVVEEGRMTDLRQGVLNPKGINCLRTFPGTGTVVFGARTLVTENSALQQWRYVPVRRTALFIEQTLYSNLGWVVFEPNDDPLWTAIRTSIEGFMLSLFRQGAFQGQKPSDAFLVKCDASTTTQTDIDNGIVNILVGFRPLKPAEFVIIKISQLAGQVQA